MDLVYWLCFLVVVTEYSSGQNFQMPDVIVEAYLPSGLRISINATPGIELFAFHGNINNDIASSAPGTINEEVVVDPENVGSVITFTKPNLTLKVNDVINYWTYMQHNHLGYRSEIRRWQITVLKKKPSESCKVSVTTLAANSVVCADTILFQDNFDLIAVNTNNWIIEQYIPSVPDFEFVIYKKDADVTFVENNVLSIKPKLITDSIELERETLDLSVGCTRTDNRECVNEKFLIQNPVISGRLVSKIAFRYGDIEVRAKLPLGDWIYPQIYLEAENNQKIVIAYSRGNKKLTGHNNDDIGGSLLFGGPVLSPKEPERSSKLSSMRSQELFSDSFHVFRLKWTPDKIELYIDGKNFGEHNTEILKNSSFYSKNAKLVLGVGVGGVNDFPNDYKSGNFDKPWINNNRLQVKKFYESRNNWYDNTWGADSQLQVDYVKIRSL